MGGPNVPHVDCVVSFLTGMGDCPEEDKDKESLCTYSTNFVGFVGNDIVLYYFYCALITNTGNLLESASTSMPPATGHSSHSSRDVSHVRPRGNAHRNRDLANALVQPVRISLSQMEKETEHWRGQLYKTQALAAAETLSVERQEQLLKV